MRLILAATCAALMLGCSMTVPVRGQLEKSAQQFTGTATGRSDGSGTLRVVSLQDAVSCSGDFVMVDRRVGRGVLSCSDKRSGPFEFATTGSRGTGFGMLGGERFTFTFGE